MVLYWWYIGVGIIGGKVVLVDFWYSGFGSIGVIVMLVVPVAEWCW